MRGEVPALEQTISGLRVGLLLAVAAIFSAAGRQFPISAIALAIILGIRRRSAA